MSFTLKDKIQLRHLQSKMHTSTFGDQNIKIAKQLDIDPRWMFQSRLNYRYIYKEKILTIYFVRNYKCQRGQ